MPRSAVPAAALAAALVSLLATAASAAACGGPIGPRGNASLSGSATLLAYHDGVEHYLTRFTLAADGGSAGWLLPLPAVPQIAEGDGAALDALDAERVRLMTPPERGGSVFGGAGAAAPPTAQVIERTRIRALDITVVRGGGEAVAAWAQDNGFTVDATTAAHLTAYADATGLVMAARFDLGAAAKDPVAPVLLTMTTPHPYYPVELLAGDGPGRTAADIYLLTDAALGDADHAAGALRPGEDVAGAAGLTIGFQEQVSQGGGSLLDELRAARDMSWVPQSAELTYLSLSADNSEVTYDLSVGDDDRIRVAAFGTPPARLATVTLPAPAVTSPGPTTEFDTGGGSAWRTAAVLGGVWLACALVTLAAVLRSRRRRA